MTEKGEKSFDRLIFAAATPIFLKTCPELPKDYVQRLTQLDFLGAQCLILVMSEKFSDMYWTNIGDSDNPILALIEHTNFSPTSKASSPDSTLPWSRKYIYFRIYSPNR